MNHRFLACLVGMVILACLAFPAKAVGGEADWDALRKAMVDDLTRERGGAPAIKDGKVLAAMLKVPRHLFVPLPWRAHAYDDTPLPIGEDQTISQPYIVALMTELLRLRRGDKVLEIGTGSGYQAAVLAELTPKVYTIEILPSLAKQARKTLNGLGYENVKTKTGDGYLGWKEYAPFDAIIVTCAPTRVPPPLVQQLKNGGRMVIPVGEMGNQTLTLLEKVRGKLRTHSIIPVRFVPLVREE